jgi:hypothetical protein
VFLLYRMRVRNYQELNKYSLLLYSFSGHGEGEKNKLFIIKKKIMSNENKDGKANENKANDSEQGQEEKEQKEKSKKQKLVRVKFNKSFTPYVQGDIAGLEPEKADDLIDKGICSKA